MVTVAHGASERSLLFDTSVIIPATANDESVVQRLADLPPEAMYVPAVAIGELFVGAFSSTQSEQALRAVELFARSATVIPTGFCTARIYGQIKDETHRRGRPIPENDVWIAALAIEHDLTRITRDARLDHITGLALDHW